MAGAGTDIDAKVSRASRSSGAVSFPPGTLTGWVILRGHPVDQGLRYKGVRTDPWRWRERGLVRTAKTIRCKLPIVTRRDRKLPQFARRKAIEATTFGINGKFGAESLTGGKVVG